MKKNTINKRFLKKNLLNGLAFFLANLILALIMNFFLFYNPMLEKFNSDLKNISFLEKFSSYISFILNGFGYSLMQPRYPTLNIIFEKIPVTLIIIFLALPIAIIIGIFIGAFSSRIYKNKLDSFLTIFMLIIYATPAWLTSLLFIIFFGCYYKIFPIGGLYSDKWISISPWTDIIDFINDFAWHLTPSIIVLILCQMGFYFLVTRNSMIDIFDEPYISLCRAKGLKNKTIIFKHALRNAILQIITVIIFSPAIIMTAVIFIEMIFSKPGLGWLLFISMDRDDYPVLQATFIILTIITYGISFITELLYTYFDPRIKNIKIEKTFFSEEKKIINFPTLLNFQKFFKIFFNKGNLKKSFINIRSFIIFYIKSFKGKFSLMIISFFILLAFAAPYIPYDPNEMNALQTFKPPSLEHLLGTDELGRDVFTRLAWGSRASLIECFGAISLSILIGCMLGAFSGYYDKSFLSILIDLFTNLFLSIPLIAFVGFFPTGFEINLIEGGFDTWLIIVSRSIILTGIATWGITAKLVKSKVISIKEKEYIESAKAIGASDGHILFKHIFPEAIRVAFSSLIYTAVIAITIQSGLDILGYGNPWRINLSKAEKLLGTPKSPIITWGTMLSWSFFYGASLKPWWTIFPPGLSLVLLTLSLIFIGDVFSDYLNPFKK
jgi:ABC-type dipeptide/oligopeptide/nickel transport system permease component